MRVVVENKIPFIAGVLEPLGVDVAYLAPDDITPTAVADADALIVRTRTRCDARLLEGSRVSFVATATIGTDHLDLEYLNRRGITVVNAPGCNAPAVAQYVLSAIAQWRPGKKLTVGVVGVGHVGSIVERWGRSIGHNMLLCDPPRAEAEGLEGFCRLSDIAERADVVTFHTPLTTSGRYPTFHLADNEWLCSLKRRPLIINSSRGAVVDNSALLAAMESGTVGQAAIDTWEGEPDINLDLLHRAFVATPHIAGYSLQGKKRATTKVLNALTEHFGLPAVSIEEPASLVVPSEMTVDALGYNPTYDTMGLKSDASRFEQLRNNYALRQEPGVK